MGEATFRALDTLKTPGSAGVSADTRRAHIYVTCSADDHTHGLTGLSLGSLVRHV